MINCDGKTIEEVAKEISELLVNQGKRCMGDVTCAYGDGKGNHCAIGHLLPEDNKGLMGHNGGLYSLLNHASLGPNDAFIREHEEVLQDIQNAHDRSGVTAIRRAMDCLPENIRPYFEPWLNIRTEQVEGESQ